MNDALVGEQGSGDGVSGVWAPVGNVVRSRRPRARGNEPGGVQDSVREGAYVSEGQQNVGAGQKDAVPADGFP